MNKNTRIALAAGAFALAAGAVGPWVSVLGALSIGPTSNAETSALVFGGIAVITLAVILGRGLRITSMIVGGFALGEAIYALVRIEQAKAEAGDWGALVAPGWGLYLTILAGIFLIVSTWIVRAAGRGVWENV